MKTLLIWTHVYFILWMSPHIFCRDLQDAGSTILSQNGGAADDELSSAALSRPQEYSTKKPKPRYRREIDEEDVINQFEIERVSPPYEISREVPSLKLQDDPSTESQSPSLKSNLVAHKDSKKKTLVKQTATNGNLSEFRSKPKPNQTVLSYSKDVEHAVSVSGKRFSPKGALNRYEYHSVSSNFSNTSFSRVHSKHHITEFEILRLQTLGGSLDRESDEGQAVKGTKKPDLESKQNLKSPKKDLVKVHPKHPEAKIISGKLNVTIIFVKAKNISENRPIYIPFGRRISTLFKSKRLLLGNSTADSDGNRNSTAALEKQVKTPKLNQQGAKSKEEGKSSPIKKKPLILNLREKLLKSEKNKATSPPPSQLVLDRPTQSPVKDLPKKTTLSPVTKKIHSSGSIYKTPFPGIKVQHRHNSTSAVTEKITTRVTKPSFQNLKIQNMLKTTLSERTEEPISTTPPYLYILFDGRKGPIRTKMTRWPSTQAVTTQATSKKDAVSRIITPTTVANHGKKSSIATRTSMPLFKMAKSITAPVATSTEGGAAVSTDSPISVTPRLVFYEPIRITTLLPSTATVLSAAPITTEKTTPVKKWNNPFVARLVKEAITKATGTSTEVTDPPVSGRSRFAAVTFRPPTTARMRFREETTPSQTTTTRKGKFGSTEDTQSGEDQKAPMPDPKSKFSIHHKAVKDLYFEPARQRRPPATTAATTIPMPQMKGQKTPKATKGPIKLISGGTTTPAFFETSTKRKTSLLVTTKKKSSTPSTTTAKTPSFRTEKTSAKQSSIPQIPSPRHKAKILVLHDDKTTKNPNPRKVSFSNTKAPEKDSKAEPVNKSHTEIFNFKTVSKAFSIGSLITTTTSKTPHPTTAQHGAERTTQESTNLVTGREIRVVFFEPLRKFSEEDAEEGDTEGMTTETPTSTRAMGLKSPKPSVLKIRTRFGSTVRPLGDHSEIPGLTKTTIFYTTKPVPSKTTKKPNNPNTENNNSNRSSKLKAKATDTGTSSLIGKTTSYVEYEPTTTSPKPKRGRSRPLMINRLKPYIISPPKINASNLVSNSSKARKPHLESENLQRSTELPSRQNPRRNVSTLKKLEPKPKTSNSTKAAKKSHATLNTTRLPRASKETPESEETTAEITTTRRSKGVIRFPPRKAFEDFHFQPIKIRHVGR